MPRRFTSRSGPLPQAVRPLLTRATLGEWLDPPLFGMIHLAPLPGSPLFAGDGDLPLRTALTDAQALVNAGFAALVVENYGDVPFVRGRLAPVTVAAMARVASAVRERFPQLRLAVNCLRNDAYAALSIAAATGADAIRVNVHCGARVGDQGILRGEAARTLRLRAALGTETRILADLRVKHAAPLAERPLAEEALELRDRGLSDAILLTGPATGSPADFEQVAPVRACVSDAPLLVASGVTAQSAAKWARLVDGAIVGSALMRGGRAGGGVDASSARELLRAWERGRRGGTARAGAGSKRPHSGGVAQSRRRTTGSGPSTVANNGRATARKGGR